MSKKGKLLALIIACIIIGIVITMVAVISHMLKTDPKRALLVRGEMPVRLARAEVKTINDIVGASGQTKEFETVTLTARITQPVVSVHVNIGNKVKKDQVLVTFDQKVIKANVEEAKEDLNRAKTNLSNSTLNYQRFSSLYNQKLIAKVDVEKADEEVKKAQWEYASAAQKLEKASQDMNYTILKSPVRGIVLERPINPGETPKLDTPLVALGLINDIFMMAKVAEEKIAYIHLKQGAEVIFDSFPNEIFQGEVVKIDPNTDPKTRTFIAYIKIPNKELKLTPGLTGFARIKNFKTALAVPTVSVINPVGETATVFIVDSNSVARIKRIKIGVSAGGLTEIVEGLKEGDKVVTAGIEFLKEGDKVNVMEEKS